MLDHFFVRRTGFPFEWIDGLRFTASREAASRLIEARKALGVLRTEFEQAVVPQLQETVRRAAGTGRDARQQYELVKAVRKNGRAPIEGGALPAGAGTEIREWFRRWNASVETVEALQVEGSSVFEDELLRMRRRLRAIAENQRFQEAVFLSSPDALENLRDGYLGTEVNGRRNRRSRWWERLLISYLQRFCTKNAATSFFGSLEYATAYRERPGHVYVKQRPARPPYRSEGLVSFWSAEALAESISNDPEVWPYLRPWRNPLCVLGGDGCFRILGKSWTAPELDRKLFAAATGDNAISQIRTALAPYPGAEVDSRISELVRRKVLRTDIQIPSQTVQPVAWLTGYIETALAGWSKSACWLDHLRKLDALRKSYGGAPLEKKIAVLREAEALFETVTGKAARRGEGAFYTDRTLLYEECYESLERFDLCRDFIQDFERRMQPILNMLATRANLYQGFVRAIGARVYDDAVTGTDPLDYFAYIAALRHMEQKYGLEEPDFNAALRKTDRFQTDLKNAFPDLARCLVEWDREMEATLRRKAGEAVISLVPPDLDWLDTSDFDHLSLFSSPDFMLCARDREALERGEYDIVISEVHATVMLWQAWMLEYPQFQRLARDMRAAMAALPHYERQACIVPPRQHRNFILEYPGYSIESFIRSEKERKDAIPLGELAVARGSDGVYLQWAARRIPLELSCAPADWLHLAIFCAPIILFVPLSLGRHTPRIVVDGIVYQREKWRIEASEILAMLGQASGFELFLKCQEYRDRLGLPEHVFVSASAEVKPFYLNWSNFFLLELLAHLVRTNESLSLTEMLPLPGDCWLADEQGHYMCELRSSFLFICEPISS